MKGPHADLADLLTGTPLFATLSEDRRRWLAEHLVTRKLRARQVLFAQGDEGTSAFLVVSGAIKLTWPSRDGEELVVRVARPPQLFGELVLLDGQPRSAWAEASVPTTLAVLDAVTWSALLGDPAFVRHLLADLAGRLRGTTLQLAEQAMVDLPGRVAAELLRLADSHGQPEGHGIRITLPMTQGELAAIVSASRQSVNQVLRSFEQRGDIAMGDRGILLCRPDVLRRRAAV